jgi:2-dehydropantoate 2-reductase
VVSRLTSESPDLQHSIAVLGAGAVGGYLGAKLALANPDLHLTLIARPAVAEAIRAHGLIIHEEPQDLIAHPQAITSTSEAGRVDAALLTVRTYDVAAAIPDLALLVGDSGKIVAFQNGVGTEEELARHFGRDRVVIATLTVSEGMEEPGIITCYSRGGGVALASMDESAVPVWLVAAFAATGLPTIVVDDYRRLRWSKLLLNMLGAATSAILDMDVGTITADPRLFRLEQLAFREAARVMDGQGIRPIDLPGYPVPLARRVMWLPRSLAQRFLGRRVAAARGGRSPGMRADLRRDKTEVATFNGAVVNAGKRLGISTPINTALTALTLDLACHPEHRDDLRGRPDGLLNYIDLQGATIGRGVTRRGSKDDD